MSLLYSGHSWWLRLQSNPHHGLSFESVTHANRGGESRDRPKGKADDSDTVTSKNNWTVFILCSMTFFQMSTL